MIVVLSGASMLHEDHRQSHAKLEPWGFQTRFKHGHERKLSMNHGQTFILKEHFFNIPREYYIASYPHPRNIARSSIVRLILMFIICLYKIILTCYSLIANFSFSILQSYPILKICQRFYSVFTFSAERRPCCVLIYQNRVMWYRWWCVSNWSMDSRFHNLLTIFKNFFLGCKWTDGELNET